MPTRVWLYLTAWLYDRPSVSGVAFAEALGTVSPAGLTRWLQTDWSGHTLLELAWRPLFTWERGSLISDDTGLPKPVATAIAGLAWRYSSHEGQPVFGLSLGLLVWTKGSLRVPGGIRLWRRGGASQSALALA
jgi:hypothetical protein